MYLKQKLEFHVLSVLVPIILRTAIGGSRVRALLEHLSEKKLTLFD